MTDRIKQLENAVINAALAMTRPTHEPTVAEINILRNAAFALKATRVIETPEHGRIYPVCNPIGCIHDGPSCERCKDYGAEQDAHKAHYGAVDRCVTPGHVHVNPETIDVENGCTLIGRTVVPHNPDYVAPRCGAKPISSDQTCELDAGHAGDHFATLRHGSTLTWTCLHDGAFRGEHCGRCGVTV